MPCGRIGGERRAALGRRRAAGRQVAGGLQTDSWEGGGVNWTARMPEEFRNRRGYDLRPWLPVIAGCIVESRDASNRFLADLRKTVGDCMADNHYGRDGRNWPPGTGCSSIARRAGRTPAPSTP